MSDKDNKAGESGYTEPRPEQKEGEGQDLGQQQAETLNEAEWNRREETEETRRTVKDKDAG